MSKGQTSQTFLFLNLFLLDKYSILKRAPRFLMIFDPFCPDCWGWGFSIQMRFNSDILSPMGHPFPTCRFLATDLISKNFREQAPLFFMIFEPLLWGSPLVNPSWPKNHTSFHHGMSWGKCVVYSDQEKVHRFQTSKLFLWVIVWITRFSAANYFWPKAYLGKCKRLEGPPTFLSQKCFRLTCTEV